MIKVPKDKTSIIKKEMRDEKKYSGGDDQDQNKFGECMLQKVFESPSRFFMDEAIDDADGYKNH